MTLKRVPLARTTPLPPGNGPKRGAWLRSVSAARESREPREPKLPPAPRKPPGEFTPAVKLLVRKRAGGGDEFAAMCEACGKGLGRYGGQVQHIVGRGMGGCRDEVINSAANAALLCGTPFDGCHGLATAFDAEIGARGFWLDHGTDPRLASMMLASAHGSGASVWRSVDGRYLTEAPEGAEAA